MKKVIAVGFTVAVLVTGYYVVTYLLTALSTIH